MNSPSRRSLSVSQAVGVLRPVFGGYLPEIRTLCSLTHDNSTYVNLKRSAGAELPGAPFSLWKRLFDFLDLFFDRAG